MRADKAILDDILESRVVDLENGESVLLLTLVEFTEKYTRQLCRCKKPECMGCSMPDEEVLAEYQMEAHDRD